MQNKIYITTTLPYANSVPHIGHALEFIQADALNRHFLRKDRVFFNVGVDEHGLKVWKKAQEEGVDVNKYLSELSMKWIEFCHRFEIRYDSFYRTTSANHLARVQDFWEQCVKRGDIYKKKYSGLYCVGCESFKTGSDIKEEHNRKTCVEHGIELESIEEENYFFRLSNYKDKLVEWLDANPEFLVPKAKTAELRNQILDADDISVSRVKKTVPWGVPVPNDEEQVIYVWFEALLNYVFAASKTDTNFNDWSLIQICGPDNLRFQGCLFQALIEAAGLRHTDKLLVHGTILDADGIKMSKTRGNVVDPIEQLNKFGITAVRYYALAGLTTCGNGNWSEEDLIKLYNDEVCNEYGNLIARVLHLIDKQKVEIDTGLIDQPKEQRNTGPMDIHYGLIDHVDHLKEKALDHWDKLEIYQALRDTNQIAKLGNKYIGDTEPWKGGGLAKVALNNLFYVLRQLGDLYKPVLGEVKLHEVSFAMHERKKAVIFPRILTEVNTVK